jgi:hypothetical protein
MFQGPLIGDISRKSRGLAACLTDRVNGGNQLISGPRYHGDRCPGCGKLLGDGAAQAASATCHECHLSR